MTTDLYFSYGSNMNLKQMESRCPNAIVVGVASLEGWRLAERTHADIIRQDGASVGGVLWQVTPVCLRSLDRYEGFPSYYTKGMVEVRERDGELSRCLTYWMADTCPHEYRQFSSAYAAGCIDGAIENSVPLDPVYQRHLNYFENNPRNPVRIREMRVS